MSKTKTKKLFSVSGTNGWAVVVLARHAKGARVVAREYLSGINAASQVEELPGHLALEAINRKEKSGGRS